MPSTIPILRARRERRLAKKRTHDSRERNLFVSAGMILSLVLAAVIIAGAFAYVNLTRDLPSPENLPILLNPPEGLILQPTRIYDRTGKQLLFTFAPASGAPLPRRYIPLGGANPQHLPESLADAVVAASDPGFWNHPGYNLNTIADPESHPTIAQKLVFDLLLFNEPPSVRRALREQASLPRRSPRNTGARRCSSGISTRRTSVTMPSEPKPPRSSISENPPPHCPLPSPPSWRR